MAVERRMRNEKKLFEAKLRQHRIEIKAETRNRKRVERTSRREAARAFVCALPRRARRELCSQI